MTAENIVQAILYLAYFGLGVSFHHLVVSWKKKPSDK